MKWSQALIPTQKETPAEAEAHSHKLMLRAGLIRKLISGAYSYLPLGFIVLKKIEEIIRQEMDATGALEVLLPAIQPVEIWEKTGRYELLKDILMTYKDSQGKQIVFGPTHEEVITDLVAGEVKSYKELPKILYQLQTKFRDEPRPRFGVLRSKEFIMKDAYSFDVDVESMNESYKKMYDAYCRIFSRCGLSYLAVEADPGFMGGDVSNEFMVVADCGEDKIVICNACKYAASHQKAECKEGKREKPEGKSSPLKEIDTPGVTTIEKVGALLKTKPAGMLKTLIYLADKKPIAVLIRGDCDVNEAKLKRTLDANILQMADEKIIKDVTGAPLGFSGPVGLKGIKLIADYSVKEMINFVTGANKKDKHLINVNLDRDFKVKDFSDLRYIKQDDFCPKCGKEIEIKTAIEVGHTFKLGTKYSKALNCNYIDKNGKTQPVIMGCYGIGVNRIIAAVIEQNFDKDGIIWPVSISPYQVLILVVNMEDVPSKEAAEEIHNLLEINKIGTLFDDRHESPGKKFKDADLIGIPLQIVIGNSFIKEGLFEIKLRRKGEVIKVKKEELLEKIKKALLEV